MESKSNAYLVEPHRKPRRKVRRRPRTMREIGMNVVVRGGEFVVPLEGLQSTPFVMAINALTVQVYNEMAVSKIEKAEHDAAVLVADTEEERGLHQKLATELRKKIQALREVARGYRMFVVDVEGGKPVNEPLNWVRE